MKMRSGGGGDPAEASSLLRHALQKCDKEKLESFPFDFHLAGFDCNFV